MIKKASLNGKGADLFFPKSSSSSPKRQASSTSQRRNGKPSSRSNGKEARRHNGETAEEKAVKATIWLPHSVALELHQEWIRRNEHHSTMKIKKSHIVVEALESYLN